MSDEDESCRACRFWIRVQHQPADSKPPLTLGRCRRHPPVVVPILLESRERPRPSPMEKMDASLQPYSRDTDWCGDFEARGGAVPVC